MPRTLLRGTLLPAFARQSSVKKPMDNSIFLSLFNSAWSIFWIIVFFGGSIFVHELGHFLAARRRGLVVERFSIGFGPKIFSWTRDGVEYRVSWLPLGGYVALPQLADMQGVEGETQSDVKKLPPISYSSKVIVAVMGAVFNVLFAIVLAGILWVAGQPTSASQLTTKIGFVIPSMTIADGTEVPSPAAQAGLEPGDEILQIDNTRIEKWVDIPQRLASSARRTEDGRPVAEFLVDRAGEERVFTVYPRLAGSEGFRQVGITPFERLQVAPLNEDAPLSRAGVQEGDIILSVAGNEVYSRSAVQYYLDQHRDSDVVIGFQRNGNFMETTVRPEMVQVGRDGTMVASVGLNIMPDREVIYPNPIQQINEKVSMTVMTLGALVNPQSDLGLRHLSGPPGIIRIFHITSQIDIRLVIWFAILVNVNLAILNLLPIPVLDGGHIVFATLAKLRGKNLPQGFITGTQAGFMILLFSLMIYVSFFDIHRWVRDSREESNYMEPVFSAPEQQEEQRQEQSSSP